jgi:hypothetical protein
MPPKNEPYSGIFRELVAAASLKPHSSLGSAILGFYDKEKHLLTSLAGDIYDALGSLDKAMASRHSEFAKRIVHLWWIGALAFHLQLDCAKLAEFRNAARRKVIADWAITTKGRPVPPYLVDDFEEVPVPEEPVPTREDSAPRGRFDWLPHGGVDFTPAGQYTVGPNGDRLLFEFDPSLPPALYAMCAVQHRPGLYMFLLESDTEEVLKIGMFGNGNLSSACSTMSKYCGRFTDTDITSKKWDSRLGPAQGIAKTLTDAATAGMPAKCHWYICMLPKVVAEHKLYLEGDLQMSARSFENGCVQAYKRAHGGEVPRYNVQEGGQR